MRLLTPIHDVYNQTRIDTVLRPRRSSARALPIWRCALTAHPACWCAPLTYRVRRQLMDLFGKAPTLLATFVVVCAVAYLLYSQRRSARRNSLSMCGRCEAPLDAGAKLIPIAQSSTAIVCFKCAAHVRRNHRPIAVFLGLVVLLALGLAIWPLVS